MFYNDYNETDPAKREKTYQLVHGLLARGVPVHGVGLQGHWRLSDPGVDEIRAAFDRYASLGVRLQVTELDVSVYAAGDRSEGVRDPSAREMDRQRERYREIFDVFREYHDVLDAVTFWGVADDETWLDDFPVKGRKDWPLLFDVHRTPKPVVEDLIQMGPG